MFSSSPGLSSVRQQNVDKNESVRCGTHPFVLLQYNTLHCAGLLFRFFNLSFFLHFPLANRSVCACIVAQYSIRCLRDAFFNFFVGVSCLLSPVSLFFNAVASLCACICHYKYHHVVFCLLSFVCRLFSCCLFFFFLSLLFARLLRTLSTKASSSWPPTLPDQAATSTCPPTVDPVRGSVL